MDQCNEFSKEIPLKLAFKDIEQFKIAVSRIPDEAQFIKDKKFVQNRFYLFEEKMNNYNE